MHSPHHGVDTVCSSDLQGVLNRVDHARMTASCDHDPAAGSLDQERLVIDQRIRLGAGLIEKEGASSVFEIGPSGYAAGDDHPGCDFGGSGGVDNLRSPSSECLFTCVRNPF